MTSTTTGTKGVYRRCFSSPATATSHVLLDTRVSSHKTRSPGQLGSASFAVLEATCFKTLLGTHQMPTWETQPTAHNLWTTSARHTSSLTHPFAELQPVWTKHSASADPSWRRWALASVGSHLDFCKRLDNSECQGLSRENQGIATHWRAKTLDAASCAVDCC